MLQYSVCCEFMSGAWELQGESHLCLGCQEWHPEKRIFDLEGLGEQRKVFKNQLSKEKGQSYAEKQFGAGSRGIFSYRKGGKSGEVVKAWPWSHTAL